MFKGQLYITKTCREMFKLQDYRAQNQALLKVLFDPEQYTHESDVWFEKLEFRAGTHP